MLQSTSFAFVDVETTGFNPHSDQVVEVACLLLDGRTRRARLTTLVNPGRPIPPYASAIHGITNADTANAPALADLAPTLQRLCAGAVVVAHNARFDLGFLPFLAHRPVLCTMRLAMILAPEAPNHKNQTLRRHFNLTDPELAGLRAHRAYADALVTSLVFWKCVDRYLALGGSDDAGELLALTHAPRSVARAALRVA